MIRILNIDLALAPLFLPYNPTTKMTHAMNMVVYLKLLIELLLQNIQGEILKMKSFHSYKRSLIYSLKQIPFYIILFAVKRMATKLRQR